MLTSFIFYDLRAKAHSLVLISIAPALRLGLEKVLIINAGL